MNKREHKGNRTVMLLKQSLRSILSIECRGFFFLRSGCVVGMREIEKYSVGGRPKIISIQGRHLL